MVVSSLTSGGMPSGENLQLYFHEGLRRHNLYPHFQNMDFSISNGNLRCKFCLECSMVGAMTMLAYVNSVSPSCVYFITLHRLHKQTRAESEHLNQNQKNQKARQFGKISQNAKELQTVQNCSIGGLVNQPVTDRWYYYF